MISGTKTGRGRYDFEAIDVGELWAELAAEYQEASARIRRLGLRRLSPGMRGVIWLLRLYVVFMLGVVAANLVGLFR
jgi:hypothetical protein